MELRALVGLEIHQGGDVEETGHGVASGELAEEPGHHALGRGDEADDGGHGEQRQEPGYDVVQAAARPVRLEDGGQHPGAHQELCGQPDTGDQLEDDGDDELPAPGSPHQGEGAAQHPRKSAQIVIGPLFLGTVDRRSPHSRPTYPSVVDPEVVPYGTVPGTMTTRRRTGLSSERYELPATCGPGPGCHRSGDGGVAPTGDRRGPSAVGGLARAERPRLPIGRWSRW